MHSIFSTIFSFHFICLFEFAFSLYFTYHDIGYCAKCSANNNKTTVQICAIYYYYRIAMADRRWLPSEMNQKHELENWWSFYGIHDSENTKLKEKKQQKRWMICLFFQTITIIIVVAVIAVIIINTIVIVVLYIRVYIYRFISIWYGYIYIYICGYMNG